MKASIDWIETEIKVADLKPFERNPRKISKAAYAQLLSSLQEDGYHQRILATHDGRVIGGHQRKRALQELGYKAIKVLTPAQPITDEDFRRILIRDNLPFGEFDFDILAADYTADELKEIGMPEDWLSKLPDVTADNPGLTDPEEIPPVPVTPISVAGDVWVLGNHRLMCGNSTIATDVEKLLNGVKPLLMVTDPPYGVNYDPTWRDEAGGQFGDGKTKMRGKVSNDDRADWTEAYSLFPGEVAYVWHSALQSSIVAQNLMDSGYKLRAQIVWVKPHFIMSRGDYHWQHEPCWYAVKKNGKGHRAGDRKQTTVWEIAGMNPAGGSRKQEDTKTLHGTQKPVECMRRPMENNSSPGQAVYEPFSGSGSSIIAAEMSGRCCYAMELDPVYVDLAVARWQNFTGLKAVHAETGNHYPA